MLTLYRCHTSSCLKTCRTFCNLLFSANRRLLIALHREGVFLDAPILPILRVAEVWGVTSLR